MANDLGKTVWPEWQIVREIGRGTFGVVYEAARQEHSVTSRSAIKVISIPQNQSEVDSLRSEGLTKNETRTYLQGVVNDFISEIQIMESFKGVQNIVSVEDYKVVEREQEIGWEIYIRMELLTPFTGYIRGRELSEKEVIKLGCDICTALELCEKRGVIHRDIKPENIFVNDFGDFKLGDFGIARRLENVSGGFSRKGTYNYMAPEIEQGREYDATADIYSLGLVLYRFMNRNRMPFIETERQLMSPGERIGAVRRRLDGEPLPAPCDASYDMAQVILYACDPDPGKRFMSASAMKNALLNVRTDTGSLKESFSGEETLREPRSGYEEETLVSSGRKKKNGIWKIPAVILAVLLLSSAVFYAVPHFVDKLVSSEAQKEKNEPEPAAEPSPEPEAASLKLRDLLTENNSRLVAYRFSRDGQGIYYGNAIGGDCIDDENCFSVELDSLDEEYNYFQGKVFLNYDYLGEDNYYGYVGLYLDGECKFFAHPYNEEYEPESFCLDLTGKKELEIVIQGANELRIADAVFSEQETDYNSRHDSPWKNVNPLESLPVRDNTNTQRFLTNARDSNGEIYYNVLAGNMSDFVNTMTYALDGKYTTFSARAFMNYHYRNISSTNTYIAVDVDGERKYQSDVIQSGMQPDDFVIDVTGAQDLTISIEGRNFARLGNVSLK
ncbi:MAG: protein kinase [Blautia sp.]|nr:protein kinase [Blautia sp.]